MRYFVSCLSLVIVGLPCIVHADSYFYAGEVTFLELSGKDCAGQNVGDKRPIELALEVNGKHITGFSEIKDASLGRIDGNNAHSLALEYSDPTIADGHEISLQGIKTPSLSGELRERKLKPDEDGCNWSRGEITAKLMPRTAEAEAHLQGLPATFNASRDEHVAWRRDPKAYAEIARLSPEVIQAESADSENLQIAVALREQLQPLYEKTFGIDHPQSVGNIDRRAELLEKIIEATQNPTTLQFETVLKLREQLQSRFEKLYGTNSEQCLYNIILRANLLRELHKSAAELALREHILKVAQENFPNVVAISAFHLGETLEKLNRKEDAIAAFGKAIAADEKRYGLDHPEVATDLSSQARLYSDLNQFAKALPLLQRALAIRENANGLESVETAGACSNLAHVYHSNGQYELALPLNLRALAIREKVLGSNHEDTAESVNNLAVLYEGMGRYELGIAYQKRRLAIAEKSDGADSLETAHSLNNLAAMYDKMGLYQEALPLCQRGLSIREKLLGSDHTTTAESLQILARIFESQNQLDKALPIYQRALAIREKTLGASAPDTATSLGALGSLYLKMSLYEKALPLLQRALKINEEVFGGSHPETAISLFQLSRLYADVGNYDQAILYAQRSLTISETALGVMHSYTANALDHLANLYGALGQHAQAIPMKLRALAIREKVFGAESEMVAISLNNLAYSYREMTQYDKALPLYQRALAMKEKVLGPEHASIAISLNNLAEIYVALGQYDKALHLNQRALAIREKTLGAEHIDTASSLNNLATLYLELDDYIQALPLLQRVLAIETKILGESNIRTSTTLNNLGNAYYYLGRYSEALPLFLKALAIREEVLGNTHKDTALAVINLAGLYKATDVLDKALPLYQRAYLILQSANSPDILQSAQRSLGNFYAAQSNPSAAIFYLKGAVNTMQSIRADSKGLDKGLQKSLLKKNEQVYKTLANLLVAEGRLAEAQQVLAMLKEDEYFDFIRRDAKADTRGIRMSFSGAEKPYAEQLDKLGSEGAALVDQLNALNKQAKLGLTPEQEQQRTQAAKQLDAQTKQTQIVLDDLPRQLPVAQQRQLAQQHAEQVALAGGVQQQLGQLGQGVTLIQYLLLGDKIQIILTDANRQIAREAPLGEAALYPKLVALRKALEDPRLDPRPWAQELYQSLIAPIEADIKTSRTLMLSLDGALRYIPFSTLFDGQRYLVERYRLSIYTAAAKDKLTAAANPQWTISGLGVTQAHTGFSALPGVQAELAGIVGKNGIPGETHLDQEFTAEQMQASLKQGNPVLHLASHFQFTPGTEADSYLLLGDGSHLSLKDIRQGDYPFGQLDLLTLSACATAMHGGQEANGKEVEGFGALAQIKGAKGVLATLWPIADASTAQLMQTLYRSRQQQHLNKAEALRQAQLALLHGSSTSDNLAATAERGAERLEGRAPSASEAPAFEVNAMAPFAHPYYWAPFILMGNWL